VSRVSGPSGSRVFITGGGGFIGSRLALRCLDQNRVTIFDTFERGASPAYELSDHRNVTLVKGDICDRESLESAMSGHDIIFHCAAVLGVTAVRSSPTRVLNTNVLGSAGVLQAASHLDQLTRVVCFSSSEVYGIRAVNVKETDTLSIPSTGDPRWSYATSKLAEEHFASAYHREMGMPISIVRPFNVYGPGQLGEGAIANFIRGGLRGVPLQVRAGGRQIRAWCFVDDMIDGALSAATRPEAVGETFNIGNPWAVETTLGLAQRVIKALSSASSIDHVPGVADVEVRIPDIGKATELLDFDPLVSLDDGIARSIDWFRENAA
jgi:UDP-glucose 4-epimerase